MFMPTKNVYVSDADLPLFERAADLAGALSTAVAAGLQLYVAQQEKERKSAEMNLIELEVDDGPMVTTKRFAGRQVLRYEAQEGLRATVFRVYRTAKGQYAIHIRNAPNWAALSNTDENNPVWNNPATWGNEWWHSGQRTLRVFPDLASMEGELPTDLIEALARAEQQPLIDDLDI